MQQGLVFMMIKKVFQFSFICFILIGSIQATCSSFEDFVQKKRNLDIQINVINEQLENCLDIRGLVQIRAVLKNNDILKIQEDLNCLSKQKCELCLSNLLLLLNFELEAIVPTVEEFGQAKELAECTYKYEKIMNKARVLAALYYDIALFIKDPEFKEKQSKIELHFQQAKSNFALAQSFFKKEQHKRIMAKRNSLKNLL